MQDRHFRVSTPSYIDIPRKIWVRTDITDRWNAQQAAAEQAMWEDRLRTAVADGLLLVYAQPIVDIATRVTVEEELLVRLRDSATAQVLPPSEFLPQCERFALMPKIDGYMVGKAIELARAGRNICVNITGQTIGDAAAMHQILEGLAAAGPTIAGRITFEVTETTALASPAAAAAFSRQMQKVGCRLALDDFGTGYGTFTELRHLAIDTLKIDQTFITNLLDDRNDERIVRAIAFVAREHGAKTIAEGVESEATVERLAELGIERAQGYLFGTPRPVHF